MNRPNGFPIICKAVTIGPLPLWDGGRSISPDSRPKFIRLARHGAARAIGGRHGHPKSAQSAKWPGREPDSKAIRRSISSETGTRPFPRETAIMVFPSGSGLSLESVYCTYNVDIGLETPNMCPPGKE